jgi:hypothetical protein
MLIIGRRDKDDHETAARPAFIYSRAVRALAGAGATQKNDSRGKQ